MGSENRVLDPPCLAWSVPQYVPHEVLNPHFLTNQENGGSGPPLFVFSPGYRKSEHQTRNLGSGPQKLASRDRKTWEPPLNPQKQARIGCGGQSLGFRPGFRSGSSVSSPSARLSYLPAANLYLTGTLQYTHTPQVHIDHENDRQNGQSIAH